jgi:hypothetical protein
MLTMVSSYYRAGLPDGLFSNQKSKSGYILEGLAMEDVGTYILWTLRPFYGLLLYLWTFGIVRVILAYLFPFWYFVPS